MVGEDTGPREETVFGDGRCTSHGTKESEAFTTVSNINDWDTYFKEIKQKLAEQIKELKDGRE